jgi:hypothetical protein
MFMKLSNVMVGSVFGVIALGAGEVAQASVRLGVDFPAPGIIIDQPISVSFFTLGWEFVANANVKVDGLGAFLGPDGFNQPQQVGLWDVSTGDLLAHAFVTGSETTVGAAPWVFASIPAVQLTTGDAYIVASQGGADFTGFVGPASFDPAISYIADAFAFDLFTNANDPLTYPGLQVGLLPGVSGWYGGNIMLVPEPSTWAMMLTGFAALAFAAHRARKSAAAAA